VVVVVVVVVVTAATTPQHSNAKFYVFVFIISVSFRPLVCLDFKEPCKDANA